MDKTTLPLLNLPLPSRSLPLFIYSYIFLFILFILLNSAPRLHHSQSPFRVTLSFMFLPVATWVSLSTMIFLSKNTFLLSALLLSTISADFARSVLVLIVILLSSLPILLFLPSLTTVTLFSMAFLIILSIAFSLFRMPFPELLFLLSAVPITFLLPFDLYIGFQFPSVSHIKLLPSPSRLFVIHNHLIFTISLSLILPLAHFVLLINTCSLFLPSNPHMPVDLFFLLLLPYE